MKIERIYGLDALRALTMYIGIVLHAAIPYKSGYHPRFWIPDPDYASFFFDHLYFWIHSFRMQLFFILSGFFTVLLYMKIGNKEFIKNRVKRILIPFVVGFIFIIPLSKLPFSFARDYYVNNFSFHSSFYILPKTLLNNFLLKDFTGFLHLWFLYNLIIFYIGFIIIIRFIIPRFKGLERNVNSFYNLNHSYACLFLALGTFILFIAYKNDLTPSIWTGFFPRNPQFLYYGMFYLFGIYLFFNRIFFEKLKLNYFYLLISGTLLSILNTYWLNVISLTQLEHVVLYKFSFSMQCILLCGGSFGACLNFLNKKNEKYRYFSDASYWVYIVHFGTVAFLQIIMIELNVLPPLRFWIVVVLTTIISYLSYHYLVRYSFLAEFLHGKRNKYSNEKIST